MIKYRITNTKSPSEIGQIVYENFEPQEEEYTFFTFEYPLNGWLPNMVYIFDKDKVECGDFDGPLQKFEKYLWDKYKENEDALIFYTSCLRQCQAIKRDVANYLRDKYGK